MATLEDYIEDYYTWVYEMMEADLPEHRKYSKMLSVLTTIEYKWSIPLDANRDIDAIDMRKKYLEEKNINYYELRNAFCDYPRSVLEVLAALSRRMEIEITGEPGNDHIERWFWVMLDNLGLTEFDDNHFQRGLVQLKVDDWLSRRIDSHGVGGIFPLKNNKIDQRCIDFYYQMQLYLAENFIV